MPKYTLPQRLVIVIVIVTFFLNSYRKVVGDRCVGGVENRFKPEPRLCPISGKLC